MSRTDRPIQPYALKAGEGWIYRFGIDFTVKAGEVQQGNGAALMEYATKKGEEPPSHTHPTEDEMFYVLEARSPSDVVMPRLIWRRAASSFFRRVSSTVTQYGETIRFA